MKIVVLYANYTMQIVGFFAAIGLVILMGLSGYSLAPESLTASAPLASASTQVSVRADSNERAAASRVVEEQPAQFHISMLPTQNIEETTASLRGAITVGPQEIADVFFIYGYQASRVEGSIGRSQSYEQVLENLQSGVVVQRVDRQVTRDESYTTRVSNLAMDTQYTVRLCAEVSDGLSCTSATQFTTNPTNRKPGQTRTPSIRVYDEELVSDNEVLVQANIDMRDTLDGIIYLIYGESRTQVEAAALLDYSNIKEDDENLQRTRVATQVRGERVVYETLEDLTNETEHFYVFCVEYDGEKDGTVCSRLESFMTPDEDFGEAPRIIAGTPQVSGSTVTLSGDVRMGPFNSGRVFFVYGTDERSIARIGGETTMERIRQSGDRLQRILVDADLDGSDSVSTTATGLLTDEIYATRLCVEFENQDEDLRDRQFVVCDEVQNFVVN